MRRRSVINYGSIHGGEPVVRASALKVLSSGDAAEVDSTLRSQRRSLMSTVTVA
jgi:hypothetical protein